MKILLLNPPGTKHYFRDNYCSFSAKADYYWPPIDLLVLSGLLAERHEVEVLDATAERLRPQAALARVRTITPGAVVAVTGTASWAEDRPFLETVHRHTGARVFVSGGFLLSTWPQVLAATPSLEGVVLNFAANGLSDYLAGATSPWGLGLRGRANEPPPRDGPPALWMDLPPSRHSAFPLRRYRTPVARGAPFTSLLASFGCAFSCRFCINGTVPLLLRAPTSVVADVAAARAAGVRDAFFVDSTFTSRRRHVEAVCDGLVAAALGVSWSCNVHAATADEDLLGLMRRAGCHTVQIGVETGSQALLDRYRKGASLDQIRRAFRAARRVGVRTLAYFIVGLPGETDRTAAESVAFARALDADFYSFSYATPDLGTPLGAEAVQRGWVVQSQGFDSSRGPALETPTFSPRQASRVMRRAMLRTHLRPRFLWRHVAAVRRPHHLWTLVRSGAAVLRRAGTMSVRRVVLARYRGLGWRVALHVRARWWSAPFRALEALIPRVGRFVSLGCGDGVFEHVLVSTGPGRVIEGMDWSAEAIRVARATGDGHPRLRFVEGDVLAWRGGPCDVVLLIDVLCCVPRAGHRRVLEACSAALAPGGLLVLKDHDTRPVWKHVANVVQLFVVARVLRWTASRGMALRGAREWEALLRGLGFTVETRRLDRGYPYPHVVWLARIPVARAGGQVAATMGPGA